MTSLAPRFCPDLADWPESARLENAPALVPSGPESTPPEAMGEERFRTLFELAPDPMCVSDMRGVVVEANRAVERLTGRSSEQIVGSRFFGFELLDETDAVRAGDNLLKLSQGMAVGPDLFAFRRPDGGVTEWEVRGFPLKLSRRSLALVVAREVSGDE